MNISKYQRRDGRLEEASQKLQMLEKGHQDGENPQYGAIKKKEKGSHVSRCWDYHTDVHTAPRIMIYGGQTEPTAKCIY